MQATSINDAKTNPPVIGPEWITADEWMNAYPDISRINFKMNFDWTYVRFPPLYRVFGTSHYVIWLRGNAYENRRIHATDFLDVYLSRSQPSRHLDKGYDGWTTISVVSDVESWDEVPAAQAYLAQKAIDHALRERFW